jgi:hypothetical protein
MNATEPPSEHGARVVGQTVVTPALGVEGGEIEPAIRRRAEKDVAKLVGWIAVSERWKSGWIALLGSIFSMLLGRTAPVKPSSGIDVSTVKTASADEELRTTRHHLAKTTGDVGIPKIEYRWKVR